MAINTTGKNYIDALLLGHSWTGNTGVGATITYSYKLSTWAYDTQVIPSSVGAISGVSLLNTSQKIGSEIAFKGFSNVANLTFQNVGITKGNDTDIVLRKFSIPNTNLFGRAISLYNNNGIIEDPNTTIKEDPFKDKIEHSDVLFSNSLVNNASEGTEAFETIMHELGHSLGLAHPHSGTTMSGVGSSFDGTIMSYNDSTGGTSISDSMPITPMIYDIATLQYLYGRNTTYESGPSTYTLNGTMSLDLIDHTAPLANTTKYNFISETIWDAGGKDIIDASTYAGGATIDLREGIDKATTVGSTKVWAAFGANIENAKGGDGNDTIHGNDSKIANAPNDPAGSLAYDGANSLEGGKGDDSIIGYGGDDTILGGDNNDRLFGDLINGNDTVTFGEDSILGGAGTDFILGGAGADTIEGGADADTMDGGAGVDLLTYEHSTTAIALEIQSGDGTIANPYSGIGTLNDSDGDEFTGFEFIKGTIKADRIEAKPTAGNTVSLDDFHIEGFGGQDTIALNGDIFNNTVSIHAGLDLDVLLFTFSGLNIVGAAFAETTGVDKIVFESNETHVLEIFDDVVAASDNKLLDIDFSGAISSGNTASLDATAVLSGSLNVLGGSGNDTLSTGGRSDTLIGGGGDDVLDGGSGSDTYIFELTDGEDTILSSELADKIEVVLNGTNTVLKGEAILSSQQNWQYEFDYGDSISGTTSYFNWTGDIDTAGSTGTLTIDFDNTLYYDLVINDFQNGDFGIDLGGTSGDGDRGGNGGNFVFTAPSISGDNSYWGKIDVRPFGFGNVTSSGYDGDPYDYTTSTGYGLYNSSPTSMGIIGIDGVGGGTRFDMTYISGPFGDPNGVSNTKKAITAGDPHIVTYDGLFYDFQDSGEFTLVQSTDGNDFIIQTRQEKWTLGTSNDMFSVNTAVATQLGTTKIGLYINGSLPYDNTLYGLNNSPFTDDIPVLYVGDEAFLLPSGAIMFVEDGLVYRNGDSYTVINNYGDGFTANVRGTHINLSSFTSPNRAAGTVEGLLGNDDGNTGNEFVLDDGTLLGASISENTLYDVFAEDWRITQSESLFLYGTGQNTSSFDNTTGNNKYVTLADLDPSAVAAAQTSAIAKGFDSTSDIFDAIVMDIVVLGAANVDYTAFWQELEAKTNIVDAVVSNTVSDLIQGTSASEIIYGTALDDVIVAQAGNDTVYAQAGDDIINGGTGDDVLVGEGGIDTFVHNRGDGNDILWGYNINQTFNNDLSIVLMNDVAVNDLYFNVSGNDLIVTDSTNGEFLTLKGQYQYTSYGYEFLSVNGIAVVGGLTIKGTSITAGEFLYGTSGSDTIIGGLGDDVLIGNAGTDIFTHQRGDGNDTIWGYTLNQTFNNDLSIVQINDASGVAISSNDLYLNVSGGDLIATDISNGEFLTLKGQFISTNYGYEFASINGIDVTNGFTVRGTSATAGEILSGGDGADIVLAQAGNDTAYGGAGNDTITGGTGDDVLVGDAGTDTFIHQRGDGNDILWGYNINQTFNNDLSVIQMNDASGVAISASDIVFTVSGGDLIVTDTISSEFLTLKGQFTSTSYGYEFDNVNGIDVKAALTLKGTNAADTIYGTVNNDTIIGGLGDDVLIGNAGTDIFTHAQGDGNDTIWGYTLNHTYNNDLSIVTLNDVNGVAISSNDLYLNVSGGDLIATDISNGEFLTLKGQFISTNYGYEFASINGIDVTNGFTVRGTSATAGEILSGGDGADIVLAQAGNDTAYGGAGNDTITGGTGDDVLVGDAGTDTFIHQRGDGNDILWGYNINQTFNNDLSVIQMNDTSGVAISVSDIFFNVSGYDLIVTDSTNGEFLTLKGQYQYTNYGFEFDNVNGIDVKAGLTIKGTSITAGEFLYGTTGSDTIIGGAGADTLTSYTGNDIFKFESLTDSTDTAQDLISDFVLGSDIIDFSILATIDDITDVTISSSAGFTYVDDNASDFSIKLTGTLALDATDFTFV